MAGQATGTSDGAFSGFLLVGHRALETASYANPMLIVCSKPAKPDASSEAGAFFGDSLVADPGGRAFSLVARVGRTSLKSTVSRA